MPAIDAEPYLFEFEPRAAALLIIDMQRDFLEPGGFGAALGNDVGLLRARDRADAAACSTAARAAGMMVVHTREGHRPDLADLRAGQAGARQSRARRSATPARWAGSWCAASPATTSSPSSIRSPASRWSTSPARARSTRPTSKRSCATAASRSCSSAASPPRSASTPRCARPTTAASTAWCWRTASARTSPNSRRWASR